MATESGKKRTRPTSFGKVGQQVDEEVEEFVRWLNDEVVPSVRRHSSRALRQASVKLSEFADYMDDLKRRP